MRIALTGASGILGGFLLEAARSSGHHVVTLGGDIPWRLGQPVDLTGFDTLIHAAFAHQPGRYRGGEGDDPEGFIAANLTGTRQLWDDSRAVPRRLFISSRAVFDALPAGTALAEDRSPAPASLYGRVKAEAEAALLAQGGAVLRATGLYGPGKAGEKWAPLLRQAEAGQPPTPRRATEVHAADTARAALLILQAGASGAFHASDLLLDRRQLIAAWAEAIRRPLPLPAADAAPVSILDCRRLMSLGWRPGGWPRLGATLAALAVPHP